MQALSKKIEATIASIPEFVTHVITLSRARFFSWYGGNRAFKYPKGTILKLKYREGYGYGIRPIAIVVAHSWHPLHRNVATYILSMTIDASGNFVDWMRNGTVLEGVKRVTLLEECFRSNIEDHFCPAETDSAEEAYPPDS